MFLKITPQFRTAQKKGKNLITGITRDTLRRVARNLLKRANKWINANNCGLYERLN